jgi:hypothetical protein
MVCFDRFLTVYVLDSSLAPPWVAICHFLGSQSYTPPIPASVVNILPDLWHQVASCTLLLPSLDGEVYQTHYLQNCVAFEYSEGQDARQQDRVSFHLEGQC